MTRFYKPLSVVPYATFAFSLLSFAQSRAEEPARWILVTAPGLRQAMEPLIQHRRKQNLKVELVLTTKVMSSEELRRGDGTTLRQFLQGRCQQGGGQTFVLLAGDFKAAVGETAEQTTVPPLRGEVGRMKGKLSDHGFGLPGEDGMSKIAVGRFPARTAEEARGMVERTLKFEREPSPCTWRNRLMLVMGNPGGGPMAEMFVQQALGQRLALLHPAWNVRTIFDASGSKYFVPSTRLRDLTMQWLDEGELFSIYMGHSRAGAMWSTIDFMTREDWRGLKIPAGGGVFFTCGCFACHVDGSDGEGFGLAAMRNPAGCVAAIGASGESYGAPGQLAADGLLACLGKEPFSSRLGEYWMAVQSGLAQGHIEEGVFKLYDEFDGSHGKVPLAVQRLEHLEMWTLLGDPALRLPLVPMDISLEAPNPVKQGHLISVKGKVPKRLNGASVRVTLERPLTSAPPTIEKLPQNRPEKREEREHIALENNKRANDLVLVTAEVKVARGEFSCDLETPSTMPWSNVLVRAWAYTAAAEAMGIRSLHVEQTP